MRSTHFLVFGLVVSGCSSEGKLPGGFDGVLYTTDGPESPPGSTDSGGDSGDTDDTGIDPPIDVDCDALPSEPTEKIEVEGARAYHGIVFDDDGNLLGWDGRSGMVAAKSDGTAEVFVPGVESAEQMVRMNDGRVFLVNQWDYTVDVISPEGARSVFARGLSGYYPYGLVLGPDKNLYVVDSNIYRLDPDTAELELLWGSTDEWLMPHSIGFSLDSRTMYIAMVGDGWLYSVDLDENLDFVGEPEPYVYLEGGWQDAVGVDVCGNLYVPDYYTSRLYKVTPEGDAEVFVQARAGGYPHGLEWGTGRDGWSDTAMYAPLPYSRNTVVAYEIGVPDGARVREWNGVRVGR